MHFINRLGLFLVIVAAVADAPALLGQQAGGGGGAGRQGAPEITGRGRQGTPPEERAGRGRAPQPRTGTAAIRGRVINATTGAPVRRASIQASVVNEQGRGEPGRSATTDDSGMFELRDLPSGRWTLRATKSGFVQQEFGQRSAFATTDPITLAEGQRFVADFRLSRGGAISGRVIDEFGDPLAGANVTAMRFQTTAQGSRTTRTGTSVPSDDNGNYRVYGLPPGQYYVSVNDPSAGRIMTLVLNDDLGDLSTIRAESINFDAAVTARQTATSYAPTYYPGTANLAEAQKLTLALGEEQSGINLSIVPVRAARITGRVTNSSGAPAQATVSLVSPLGQGFSPSGRNGSGADGSFTLTNVPPGNYTLNVLGPTVGTVPPEVASMPIVVSGQDILGLNVITGSGASVQGTVVSDNGTRLPAARMRVTGAAAQNNTGTFGTQVGDNGMFKLEGLLGVYTLRFESLPAGWIVKSITANGVDVSDAAIDFRPGDRVSMRVELTDRVTQVSGSVRSDRPVTSATVVIFADDPAKWTANSRFVKTARLTDGRFTVSGLPPHQRYLAVAVDYIEPGEPQNAEFLQRAKAAASTSFGLSAGDQRVVDLPLIVR